MSVLSNLVDEWLSFRWRTEPVEATFVGIHDYDRTLGDYDPDHLEEMQSTEARYLNRFRSLDSTVLESSERADQRLIVGTLQSSQALLEQASPWKRDACIYPEICLGGVFLPLVREYAPLEERARAIASRLLEVPKVLAQGKASLQRPVKSFGRIALDVVAGGKSFVRHVLPPVGEQVPSLGRDLERGIEVASDALDDYEAYLKSHAIPRGTDQFALGKDLFELLLRERHFLPYDCKDLLAIGEELLARTREEMEQLAQDQGRSDGWMSWVEEVKGKHPDPQGLKHAYRTAMEQARGFVIERDLVTIPPGESIEVIWTPEFERSQIPYAAYMPPGPLEKRQQGFFYVTPVEEHLPSEEKERRLRGSSFAAIPVTALHEGYPGHHLQLCVANRHPSLARKVNWSSLFGEGWALYCEDLMYEQGFHSEPATRLMQLKDLLWRGVRVVLDVKMHVGTVTLAAAVDMLVNEAKLEEPNAIAEAKRYTRTPTQPMSYTIGKRLILEILSRYRQAKGEHFSLREFHDRLLACGNIPPALAERELLGEGTA
jgi:hypothetical protein